MSKKSKLLALPKIPTCRMKKLLAGIKDTRTAVDIEEDAASRWGRRVSKVNPLKTLAACQAASV